jgi:geranylgeranyl diphosphate synthase type 3
MIAAFDAWIKVPTKDLEIIKNVVEMLHTSSLLIDDVEDGSELRRGNPVAHKIFGVASTINSANYVYFLALEKVLELDSSQAVKVFTQEMLQLHRGQGCEIYYRDAVECPTQEEYLEIVSNKTGGLLRLAVKLMCGAVSCQKEDEYISLVNTLGIHFQIRDDYVNLLSSQYQDTKGFAEDITEGKFSFPIVHCIQNSVSKKHQLLNILRQRTVDNSVKKYAIGILTEAGSLEYTRKYLSFVETSALDKIKNLGGNHILEEMISWLSKEYK